MTIDQQTIRLFEEGNDAPPRRCSLLQHVSNGKTYEFHLVRLRSRIVRRGEGRQDSGHRHDVFHLVLVTDGRGRIFIDGESVLCERGQLLCINPGQLHHINGETRTQIVFIALTFFLRTGDGRPYTNDLSQFLQEFSGIPMTNPPKQPLDLPSHVFEQLRNQLELLLDLLLQPESPQTYLRANLQFTAFFGELASFLARSELSLEIPQADAALERVRSHIREHMAESLTIQDLARIAGMSTGHLQRRFKQLFGISPIAYQQQLRIDRARRMLNDTDWPLADIAERVGYANVYYFSTVFKKTTGTSPGQFRRELRQQESRSE